MTGKPRNKPKQPVFTPLPTVPPRPIAEIDHECSQHLLKAGQLQYQVAAITKTLADINARLTVLNDEAKARQALDEATKTAAVNEVANES